MVVDEKWVKEFPGYPEPEPCYYCYRSIEQLPYIEWRGGPTLYLHPECAVEWTIRLLRDVHQVETNEQPITRPIRRAVSQCTSTAR